MRKKGAAFRRRKGRPPSDVYSLFTRQRGRCWYCRRPMSLGGADSSAATRDHVIPRSRGGKTAGNVVAACYACNQRKRAMLPADFKSLLANLEG